MQPSGLASIPQPVPGRGEVLVKVAASGVNPLGIKGVGEIGITGSAGAVANAVFHATGIRVRNFPIKIEDVVIGLSG